MMQRRHFLAATGAVAMVSARPVRAAWPDRPVRMIVPFAAGGNTDVVARILQQRLQEKFAQPFVVENRPGAGGSLGGEAVARARPDGYTLLVGSNGPLSVNPVVQARMPYDSQRDFAPIGLIMQVPHCLVVQPNAPFQNLADIITASRAQADALGVGTAGVASATHLALESFKVQSGARLLHVPYRGAGAALPDFLAGNLPMLFTELSTALQIANERKGRIIAVASTARLPALPDVPTIIEGGFPGFTAASYVGLLAPAGTPQDVMRPLSEALLAITAEPSFRQRMGALGGEAAGPNEATPAGFAELIRADIARSRRAAEAANIKAE